MKPLTRDQKLEQLRLQTIAERRAYREKKRAERMKIQQGDGVQFSIGNKTKNGIVSRVENNLAHVVYINSSTKSMFQLGYFYTETFNLTKLEPKAKK